MLADALEHLVRGVVEHPDDVSVRDKQLRRGSILEVRVHPTDLGKVIGRGGRTATAFRTVISSLAGRGGARIDFVDMWTVVADDRLTSNQHNGHHPSGSVPIGISAGRDSVDSSASTDDFVVVGRIGPAHGLKGEVFVEPRTDEPERRFATGKRLQAVDRELTVAAARTHSGRLVVRFEEIPDRNSAEAARGTELKALVDTAELPEDPEEFYDHQLLGLRVETVDGEVVGELDRIEHNAAQDLLVIRTPDREVLFPFVTALVPQVDVRGGRIVIDDRPGLLEDY